MGITRADERNVFDWLDGVRARPSMYVHVDDRPLQELELLVYGYYAALNMHGLVEPVPHMTHHFLIWLHEDTGWSTCKGWADAIGSHLQGRAPLDRFFQLVDRYRVLVPEIRAVGVPVRARRRGREPTKQARSVTEQPSRLEIVRYRPTKLHFLRRWHGMRAVNEWIFMDGQGNHAISLAKAKRLAVDIFPDQEFVWQAPTSHRSRGR
jgi:hypothetical protein